MTKTALLIVTVAAVLLAVSCGSRENSRDETAALSGSDSFDAVPEGGTASLIDLGSTTCVPCRMMVDELAMLDSLTGEQLEVHFIDVNASPDEASEYGIRIIPTQIFLSETGDELYRHEGFISCDDMMARWTELGYSFVPVE